MRNDEQTILDVQCPITRLLEIMSAKWTIEILREVAIGPTRTRKFLRTIPGLSMKSLQCRLKDLETNGLIKRIDYGELPRRVDHVITDRGRQVLSILFQIKELADETFSIGCSCPFEKREQIGNCHDFECPRRPLQRK